MSTPFEQLNDDDLELVSSYLDGEVTAAERAAFEARLQREPALRAALDELRATTQLIRELPRMTPPRSFTIDPASARPRWAGAFGWLRFGSALAAVLLALTVTFDVIGSRGMGTATSSAPQAAVMNDQSAGGAASGAATSAENSAPAAAESGPANTNSNAASLAPRPTAAAAASGAAQATPPAAQPLMVQPALPEQATETVQATDGGASNTMELRSAEQPTRQEQADARAMITAQAGGVAASDGLSPGISTFEQPATKTIPPQEPFRPLRLVEFSLAALTIVLGLAALWVARQGRRR